MAMTLADMIARSQDPIATMVVSNFWDYSDVARLIPFVDVPGGTYRWNRRVSYGNPAFRTYGTDFASSEGQLIPQLAQVKVIGGRCQVDAALLDQQRASGQTSMLEDELRAHVEASARDFTKWFFDGDSAGAPAEFDGVNVWCTDSTSGKKNLVYAGDNGAVLSTDLLYSAIACIPGRGSAPATFWIGSYAMKQELRKLWETQLGSQPDTDEGRSLFGVPLDKFAGIPFIQIGADSDDAEILGFDETRGSSSVTGSLYLARFDLGHVHGIQTGPLKMLPPSGGDSYTQQLYLAYQWLCAPVPKVPNSIVRVAGVLQAS